TAEVTRNETAARRSLRLRPLQIPEVRDHSEAPPPVQRQPGSVGAQIATGQDVQRWRPFRHRRRGTLVKLIPVRGDHEGVPRVCLPGYDEQAHVASAITLEPG